MEPTSEIANAPGKARLFWDNAKSLIGIAIAVIVIRSSLAAPYKIPSGSMIPTLEIGDHIFVSKLSFGIKFPAPFTNFNMVSYAEPTRGDIIVFEYPEDPSLDYIKRVIGIPGDKIEMKGRQISINGKTMPHKPITDGPVRMSRFGGRIETFEEDLGTVKHQIQHYSDAGVEDFTPADFIVDLRMKKLIPADSPSDRIPEGYYFVMGDNRDDSRDSRYWGFVPFANVRGLAKIIWFSWDSDTDNLLEKIRFDRLFKIIS